MHPTLLFDSRNSVSVKPSGETWYKVSLFRVNTVYDYYRAGLIFGIIEKRPNFESCDESLKWIKFPIMAKARVISGTKLQ